jgi:hypothetical protein
VKTIAHTIAADLLAALLNLPGVEGTMTRVQVLAKTKENQRTKPKTKPKDTHFFSLILA